MLSSSESSSAPTAPDARLLQQYVEAWERHGIITPDQGEAILAYHQTPRRPRLAALIYSRLVVILATFGAILVGAGVILFVASNWQEIARWQKLVLILGTTAVTYALGYLLRYQRPYPRIGEALLFLAAIFYGAGIFLVGQLYHFNTDNPYLHLAWFVGVFPLAYLLRSRAILSLAILVGLWDVGLFQGRRLDTSGISSSEVLVFTLYLTLGAGLYALGLLHARFARTAFYTPPYTLFGALVSFLFLFMLSFEWVWDAPSYRNLDLAQQRQYLLSRDALWFWRFEGTFTFVAVASVVGALVAAARARRPWGTLPYEGAALLLLLAAASLALFLPFSAGAPYIALFNLLLAALIVGVVVAGVVTHRPALVNVGIVFFALDVITRYIEIAWDMLETSLFFILGGLFLLGLGYLLERARRRLLARLALAEVEDEP